MYIYIYTLYIYIYVYIYIYIYTHIINEYIYIVWERYGNDSKLWNDLENIEHY